MLKQVNYCHFLKKGFLNHNPPQTAGEYKGKKPSAAQHCSTSDKLKSTKNKEQQYK
jgi:hypothetical protein